MSGAVCEVCGVLVIRGLCAAVAFGLLFIIATVLDAPRVGLALALCAQTAGGIAIGAALVERRFA